MTQNAPWARAQEEGGPTPEEIAQFEREFAPPVTGGPDETRIEKPQFEEPGQIPDEVRSLVAEKDLVAVHCVMTKWKSGRFFAAMDAIESLILPAAAKIAALGITLDTPDPSVYRAEGQGRVDAICAAKDSVEVDRLIREFVKWGESTAFGKFAAWRTDLRAKIDEYAAKMRIEVKAALDPFVEEQKQKILTEIDAKARALAKVKSARFAGRKQAPSAAEIAALKAEINSDLAPLIAQRKSEVAAAIQAKVKELIGEKSKSLIEATDSFKGMEKRVNDAINAGTSKYDSYREEAISLRKKMVLDLLDKSMRDGLKELDAHAAEIDEARKADPGVPGVGEVKSKLTEDRRALEVQLDAALRSGDETAFQKALNDFRLHWENYRTEMEQAAQQSVAKICTMALAQFDNARKQMAPGKTRIDALLAQCDADTSEKCVHVNEFSDRLGTLAGKLDDLALEMAAAEKMCSTPETADRQNLLALMKKIQTDGEAVRTYGEALDAAKDKALASGVKEMCDQSLPQLKAAETEIAGNDMVRLKTKLASCKGKNTDECKAVLKLDPAHDKLAARVAKFLEDVADVRASCAKGDPSDIERLSAILEGLKREGGAMRAAAKDLNTEVAAEASAKAFCKAVTSQLDMARQVAAQGLSAATAEQNACAGRTDPRCAKIKAMAPQFAALIKRVGNLGVRIGNVLKYCASASAEKMPDAGILTVMEEIRAEQKAIPDMAAAIRAEGEKVAADAQSQGKMAVWIEAESDVRTSLLPRTEQWHSIKGTSNDSWRPPVFGAGYWYLSRGGEWLEYDVAVPADGTYKMWIRDLASNVPGQEGQGIVTVTFDGKSIGSFAENEKGRTVAYPKGAINWHKVADVKLTKGKHVLRITKQSTSSRAAILDAYYLITGDAVPAER